MEELITNIHMHTHYSDGEGSHAEIGQAALRAGMDVVFVTDHNVLVSGMDGYYNQERRRVLMLVGEEVHDRTLDPQRNHMLVLGADRELTRFSPQPQQLINQARQADGLTFIAHPHDAPMPAFNEVGIPWENWQVHGYTGIELWNGFGELKEVANNKLTGLFYALFPHFIPHGPLPQTLKLWDTLTKGGARVVAIGGSDAHAYHKRLGPIRKRIFSYAYHFSTINNHLLVPGPLTGNLLADRKMVLSALAQGHTYVGYDLPLSTRGFRFNGQGKNGQVNMGDEIACQDGITFQIRLPTRAECHLLKDGKVLKVFRDREINSYTINQPGVYRVECYLDYLGRKRGWIFSNPIYVR
jgi:hypothetical protein